MRQLVCIMFITNNRASFHLWWNQNLVKHQKVWKYYRNDSRSRSLIITCFHDLIDTLLQIFSKKTTWLKPRSTLTKFLQIDRETTFVKPSCPYPNLKNCNGTLSLEFLWNLLKFKQSFKVLARIYIIYENLEKLLKVHSHFWDNFWQQNPLKVMKNAFSFTSKALFVIKIFQSLS